MRLTLQHIQDDVEVTDRNIVVTGQPVSLIWVPGMPSTIQLMPFFPPWSWHQVHTNLLYCHLLLRLHPAKFREFCMVSFRWCIPEWNTPVTGVVLRKVCDQLGPRQKWLPVRVPC